MLLFPVLRRWYEGLAFAYAGFRSLEAVFLIRIEAKLLSLIDVSEEHLGGSGVADAPLQAVGNGILAEIDRLFVLYVLVFTAGALILYGMLYESRLVPRWVSGWGFSAAAWMWADGGRRGVPFLQRACGSGGRASGGRERDGAGRRADREGLLDCARPDRFTRSEHRRSRS